MVGFLMWWFFDTGWIMLLSILLFRLIILGISRGRI